jgi:hypothetical protein
MAYINDFVPDYQVFEAMGPEDMAEALLPLSVIRATLGADAN